MIEKVTPAQLVWGEDNLPRSKEFGDLYFSAEDGLEETNHVFVTGNNLSSRWSCLEPNGQFVIAETGFGSGLNLLAAARLWQQIAPATARLQFVSVEKHPMHKGDLIRALEQWEELTPLALLLAENYPPLTPGFHRFELLPNVEVTLVFDDIESGLRSLCPPLEPKLWHEKPFNVDAWFLDGFAPSKNPNMWGKELFPLINRLSTNGTTIATFTAAGDVRRALQRWGFQVAKVSGYGNKREMITATFLAEHQIDLTQAEQPHKKPTPCWTLCTPQVTQDSRPIAVIGAGIAGATLASALAKRGNKVHVFESGSSAAVGASGITQVALYARLSPDQGELEDFMLTAMPFSNNYYRKLLETTDSKTAGELCGLIQLPRSEAELKKMELVSARFNDNEELVRLLQSDELSNLTGIRINSAGLFFPNSGWLNGAEICSALLNHSNISVTYDKTLERFDKVDDEWRMAFKNGETSSYRTLVICASNSAKVFKQLDWLPTRAIRGQVSLFEPPFSIRELSRVLCREIQLTPGSNQYFCTGSTYDLDDTDTSIRQEDHQKNIAKLNQITGQELSPDLASLIGQSGIRCSTPDYLPMVGPAPNYQAFVERYAALRKDAKSQLPFAAPVEKGLFINLGYGSRGYTYAPLCAEQLANQICGGIGPLPNYLHRATHPARFLIRGLTRGKY